MKKVRSYSSIWAVEKVLYAVNDVKLPLSLTFSQITWFIISLLMIVMLQDIPPFSLIDGVLLKYVGIPAGITWFMSQKTLDGKKPYRFLQSVLLYYLRPKITYGEKAVKSRKEHFKDEITAVRSEIYYGVSH